MEDFLVIFGHYNKNSRNYYFTPRSVPLFGEVSLRGIFWSINNNSLILNYNYLLDQYAHLVLKKEHHTLVALAVWDLSVLEGKYTNKFHGGLLLAKRSKGIHSHLFVINKLPWAFFLDGFLTKVIKPDFCFSSSSLKARCLFRISDLNLLKVGYDEYTVVDDAVTKIRSVAKYC